MPKPGAVATAVLISGSGTNLQALIDAAQADDFPAAITLVISNRPDAGGIARAAKAGIECVVIDHKAYADRASFDGAINQVLRARNIEIVCLAGFMRLLTPDFVNRWAGRMLNIHPSLLPAFPGLHVQARAIEAGVRFSGCTVHLVTPDMDQGPILVQAVVPIHEDDTPESLAARIQVQEHRAYPLGLRLVADGRVKLDGNRARITDAQADQSALLNPKG
jgi:phosphoribosylglycinamide formyltransferase-1